MIYTSPVETQLKVDSLQFTNSGLLRILDNVEGEHSVPIELIDSLNSFLPPDWDKAYLDPDSNDLGLGDPQQGLRNPYTNSLVSGIDGNRLAYLLMLPYLSCEDPDYQFVEVRKHVDAHFDLARIMVEKMRNSTDQKEVMYAAKFTLYVLVPLMRLYEIPSQIGLLEDEAFRVIDPKGYEAATRLWGKERYSFEDLERMETELYKLIEPLLDESSISTINLRQKSLLSFYRKFRSGRDYRKDALASTIVLNNRSNNRSVKSLHVGSFIGGLYKAIGIEGFSLTIDENYYESPRVDDRLYSAVDCVLRKDENSRSLRFSALPEELELRITTIADHERSLRTHVWYKQVVQCLQNLRLVEGANNTNSNVTSISGSDFNSLADIARAHAYLKFDGRGETPHSYNLDDGQMLFDSTPLLLRHLRDVFQARIPLGTPRGNRVLLLKEKLIDDESDIDEVDAGARLDLIQMLNSFSQAINPEIFNKFSPAFEVRRVEKLPSGVPIKTAYRIVDIGNGQFQIHKIFEDGMAMSQEVLEPFHLKPFDLIKVLVGSNGSYKSLVTIGEILDTLSVDMLGAKEIDIIEERYIPVKDELLIWSRRLEEINIEMSKSHSDRDALMKAHRELVNEIRLAVSLCDTISQPGNNESFRTSNDQFKNLSIRRMLRSIAKSEFSYLMERIVLFLQEKPEGEDQTYFEIITFGKDFPQRISKSEINILVDTIQDVERMSEKGVESAERLMKILRERLTTILLNPSTDAHVETLKNALKKYSDQLGMTALSRIGPIVTECKLIRSGVHPLLEKAEGPLMNEFDSYVDQLLDWMNEPELHPNFQPNLNTIKELVEAIDFNIQQTSSLALIDTWDHINRGNRKQSKKRRNSLKPKKRRVKYGDESYLQDQSTRGRKPLSLQEIELQVNDLRDTLVRVISPSMKQKHIANLRSINLLLLPVFSPALFRTRELYI